MTSRNIIRRCRGIACSAVMAIIRTMPRWSHRKQDLRWQTWPKSMHSSAAAHRIFLRTMMRCFDWTGDTTKYFECRECIWTHTNSARLTLAHLHCRDSLHRLGYLTSFQCCDYFVFNLFQCHTIALLSSFTILWDVHVSFNYPSFWIFFWNWYVILRTICSHKIIRHSNYCDETYE